DSLIGLAETPNNLNAVVVLKIGDEYFDVKVPLSYKKLDPVKGDVVEQLRIVPDVTVEFVNNLLLADPNGQTKMSVRLHANKGISGKLRIVADHVPVDIVLCDIDDLSLKTGVDTVMSCDINVDGKEYPLVSTYLQTGSVIYNKTQHLIQY